jgi:hypothetical protein
MNTLKIIFATFLALMCVQSWGAALNRLEEVKEAGPNIAQDDDWSRLNQQFEAQLRKAEIRKEIQQIQQEEQTYYLPLNIIVGCAFGTASAVVTYLLHYRRRA